LDEKGEVKKLVSADRKLMPSGKEKLFKVFEVYLDAKIGFALGKTSLADFQLAEGNFKSFLSDIAIFVE